VPSDVVGRASGRSRSLRRSKSDLRFTSTSGPGRRARRGRRPTDSEWQLLGQSSLRPQEASSCTATQSSAQSERRDLEGVGNLLQLNFPRTEKCRGSLHLRIRQLRRPTNFASSAACRRDAGASSFTNQRTFEFGECSHDMEEKSSARGTGVDSFRKGDEANATILKVHCQVDQMCEAPS